MEYSVYKQTKVKSCNYVIIARIDIIAIMLPRRSINCLALFNLPASFVSKHIALRKPFCQSHKLFADKNTDAREKQLRGASWTFYALGSIL